MRPTDLGNTTVGCQGQCESDMWCAQSVNPSNPSPRGTPRTISAAAPRDSICAHLDPAESLLASRPERRSALATPGELESDLPPIVRP